MKLDILSAGFKVFSLIGALLFIHLSFSIWSGGIVGSTIVFAQQGPRETIIDTLVSIDGFRLNFRIYRAGRPTILLEAGGGMDHTEWDAIAPELSKKTGATVVSYDRAGFGRSDLPEHPCDIEIEAGWLWKAMKRLEFKKDIVLVGHSYGGWMIRIEASENPAAVIGIVFIDPFSVEFVDLLGVAYLDQHPMAGKLPFDTSRPEKLTKHERALMRMVGDGLGPKVKVMRETAIPKGIPVFIIKSGLPTLQNEEEQNAWNQALDTMAASIEGAFLIVAEESDHMIPLRQPDLIVETVVKTIDLVNFEK
jgi:pimeloyl-ACP methyl ester carboxylesterase